ncbi:hypothetical protein AAV94_08500 [Lampropedia cohaerens]|uniref:DNA polymerase III subunit delta n=1 Tax=Lampropedia cohaerens TaxID=1610491 RepID=A0A0U1PZ78_9BURK|nr:hypothetical protein [Lampropedia cohaerens]KKW67824.1 hypothetical protein AAV94_08500 [Lampropedia cohaerens]
MPWLVGQLQALLQQQGHALLLEGPSGLGQFELGLAYASAVLCERQPAGAPLQPACGQCESCHAIAVHTHPDLLVLLPEALQQEWGWGAPDAESSGEAKRKPSKEIRIEAMRQMITFSQRTDARGRGKVVLIYPAESMNTVTANALLKTLEEPPGNSRFVLVSDASHRLLPTIRSRCHAWHMHWPRPEAVASWLASSQGEAAPDGERLQAALAAAGGRPQDARQLLLAGFDGQSWRDLPRSIAHGEPALLAQVAPGAAITMLQQLCHDVLTVLAGATPRYFPREAVAPLVPPAVLAQRPLRQRAFAQLTQWGSELMAAARTSEHPFSQELMLAALVERARSALHFRM